MRKKNYKGRCEKKSVPKCNEIFKAYDAIQNAYVRRKNSIVHGGYDMHVKIEVNYVMHW